MRFLLLSDIHLVAENPVARMDNLVETQWGKLEFVLNYAKENDLAILQAGDLTDTPRSWLLLPRLISTLKKYGVEWFSVRGQHDDYMYSTETRERTNLGILERAGLVHLLNTETPAIFEGGDIQIYGANFGQKLAQVHRDGLTLGVIHASISDKSLYPGHIFSKPSDFLSENDGYDLILCGDIHRMFISAIKGRTILNVGPMLRLEGTDYNFKHKPGFAIFDSECPDDELPWVEIPHEPAEKVLSREHIERKKEAEELLKDFVRELEDVQLDAVSFKENLWRFIRENKVEQSVIDVIAMFVEERK